MICLSPANVLLLHFSTVYKMVCVFVGPTIPLHIPFLGVHRHCHHLHHHPPCGHRPAADAHFEVLLLGHQPSGVQWNHPQRSWYVYMCILFAHKQYTCMTLVLFCSSTKNYMLLVPCFTDHVSVLSLRGVTFSLHLPVFKHNLTFKVSGSSECEANVNQN